MDKLQVALEALPWVATITAIAVGGWLFHTWLRIKHGYPLDGAWGQAIYPSTDREAAERIKLLTNENAQLRAERGAVKDRLETPSKLAREIDALSIGKGGHA